MITFRIRGIVREEGTGVPLPGLFIKAYDRDLMFDDLLGSAVSDAGGRFEIVTEPGDFRDLFEKRPDLYFRVHRAPGEEPVHTTRDAVRWNAREMSEVEIRVPRSHLAAAEGATLRLTGDDGEPREAFEIGESLTLAAEGLRPLQAHDVQVSLDGRELFTSRLLADGRGAIESTVLWPQMGLDDPSSERRFTPDEAAEVWAGRRLDLVISVGRETVASASARVEALGRHPVVIASDAEGRVLNAFEADEQPLFLALRALPFSGPARVYVVPRQHDWRVGDPLEPAPTRGGKAAVREIELPETRRQAVVEVLPAGALYPGAYDFVIRPLRYGYEEDELPQLLDRDIVGSRRVTGLVIRENFWNAKPVLGGCVNKLPVSGRSVAGAPYFQYSDTFEVGEDVWAALDPGIVDPGNVGKMCALYVIPSKTDAQWDVDNSLAHLPVLGGNAAVQKIKLQTGCINANKVKVWPAAMLPGQYDIVADFGNNVPDAALFVPDDAYNTPLDIIDGYFVAGFRVVKDPGTMTDFAHAGTWHYTEATVAAMGMPGTVNVDDENDFYAVPGGFSVLVRQVALKARVFYPADVPGVTDPAQISAAQPSYPLVVIVHGNVHDYTSYDFLLSHLARNGFVAASIDNRYLSAGNPVHGMHGLGRANNLFRHLAVLQAKFGTKLQNNVGIMGHSRGGEGVLKAARLNQQQGLGHNLNAIMSLAPTDQYGREVLGGAWAKPYFVLYGSRDGDVAGWSPADLASWGYPDFTWRSTGFSLYDRAGGAPKSMAFLYRATHNGFITSNSDNGEAGVIAPATQQAVTKAYTTAFFRRHLRNEPEWEGMFSGEWKPASVAATGAELHVQYRVPGGRTADDFEGGGAPNWQASTIGGTVSHGGTLPADPSEGRLIHYPLANPGLDTQSPHDSKGLRLQWNNAGDRLTFSIPAASQDVRAFSVLSLRVAQTVASGSNPAGQPQDLRVALKDAANNERAIRVSAFGAVPYPDQRANVDHRKSALSTIRIPLASYTIVCAGQPKVDLEHVTELSLVFDLNATGDIQVDEIEFTA
jgi:dienelactone hydrolase